MIDRHNEYTHGMASDHRRQHLPPSSSDNGWDFSPTPDRTLQAVRIAPGLLVFVAVVVVCGVLWGVNL